MARGAGKRWHSVSSVLAYEECPRRYGLAYVQRVPPERLAPSHWRLGRVVHAGLEAAYKALAEGAEPARVRDAALAGTRAAGEAEELQGEAGSLEQALALVESSTARLLLETTPEQVLGVEVRLSGKGEGGVLVHGFVDVALRAGPDALELRDHKVTRKPRAEEELRSDFQLGLYGWLARRRWSWAERVWVSHHYPLQDAVLRVELAPTAMEQAAARLSLTALAAEKDKALAAHPGSHCQWCAWQPSCPEGRGPEEPVPTP